MGCQKTLTNEDLVTDVASSSKGFNAAFAKEWYYSAFKKSADWLKAPDHGQKLPDWKGGIYYKIGDMEVVDFPLQKEKTKISIPSANSLTLADRNKLANASLKRILFIKNSENNITLREVDYIPDWQYLQKKKFDISNVAYGKGGDDFTGKMIVKDWEGASLSIRLVVNGKITQVGKIKNSNSKVNNITGTNNTENVSSCTTFEFCIWQQDCVVILTGDVMGSTCGEWYNTYECWTEEFCEGEEEEDPSTTYGVGCNGGGGGGEQCDPSQVSTQEGEYNDYILMESTPADINTGISNASNNPISDVFSWDVTSALIAGWKIKANTNYSYIHDSYYDLNTNSMVHTYNLYYFHSGQGYFEGSNTFIQSTYTQANPTNNQVINNNTSYTQGKSHVIGSVKHVMSLPLNLPYCPKVIDQSFPVDGNLIFTPR